MNELMRNEWLAWRLIVTRWPGNMNNAKWNSLIQAIQLWGERLVALRGTQDPVMVAQILRDAETRCPFDEKEVVE